ncbi:hypothetical protein GCM10017600_72350 [Streptosporangium carneum]|uniref:Uncharacterized protein n=2 Tax=Streptosporangium carneum TaxID=47481 RepID=A0A9W6MGJ7_9ACTN|nr:hypothetical protein GCM10017600_72350 [Streptosporangium carneum]
MNAPTVRHRLRRFPEGTPFLKLRLPGEGDATLFLDGHQWIFLSEPGDDRPATQFAAGLVEDAPEVVVERVMSVMARRVRRAAPAGRALKSCALGLVTAVGVGLLSAVVMAILIGGNGYPLSDVSSVAVYVLAALLGVAAGVWVGVRWWRRLG